MRCSVFKAWSWTFFGQWILWSATMLILRNSCSSSRLSCLMELKLLRVLDYNPSELRRPQIINHTQIKDCIKRMQCPLLIFLASCSTQPSKHFTYAGQGSFIRQGSGQIQNLYLQSSQSQRMLTTFGGGEDVLACVISLEVLRLVRTKVHFLLNRVQTFAPSSMAYCLQQLDISLAWLTT